jgi:hypothetical protein
MEKLQPRLVKTNRRVDQFVYINVQIPQKLSTRISRVKKLQKNKKTKNSKKIRKEVQKSKANLRKKEKKNINLFYELFWICEFPMIFWYGWWSYIQ